MKIAVASEGSIVSQHFGHCDGFTLYYVESNTVTFKEFVSNPGHTPGYLPAFLKEQNIDAIIAGGMGEAAKDLFVENGIQVFVGVDGEADQAANKYAKGLLKSTEAICTEHKN